MSDRDPILNGDVKAIFGAEMVVAIAILMGAAVTVNGHTIWAYVVGMAP